jgi:hypothetical protein
MDNEHCNIIEKYASCVRPRITVGPGPSQRAIPSHNFCGGLAFVTMVRKVDAI